MRYDMRPDKSGWTIFDVNTGRTVSLGGDLVLMGVDYEEADRLVDLLNAGDSQWEAAFATEAAVAPDFNFKAQSELLWPPDIRVFRLIGRCAKPDGAVPARHGA